MSFVPHRSDYTKSTKEDVFYTKSPASKRFEKAERTYDFYFPERLGVNGKPFRTHGKENYFWEQYDK